MSALRVSAPPEAGATPHGRGPARSSHRDTPDRGLVRGDPAVRLMEPASTQTGLAPATPLGSGERPIARFPSDRAVYWREHAWIAACAMAFGMAALWLLGNPHVWTGAVGGLAAVAVRALYLASDETGTRWELTNRRLLGPGHRAVALEDIADVGTILSAVRIVTVAGDKHLLKYQADVRAVKSRIDRARGATRPTASHRKDPRGPEDDERPHP